MKFPIALILAPLAAGVAVSHYSGSPEHSPTLKRQAANVSSSSAIQPVFTFNQLWDFNKKFLDNFIYPANVQVAKAINSTLLAEDVQGRVDVTRTFTGRELNTEYLFGLFANLAASSSGGVTLLGVPLSYEILHFAASQNVVSALTRYVLSHISLHSTTASEKPKPLTWHASRFQFNFTAVNLVIPVEIDAWNTYNDKGQISQYDATFKWWQWTVDYLLQAAGKKFGTNSTQATVDILTQALAKSICGTSQTYCNGTNVQYQSADECFAFLTKEVRFGAAYELGTLSLSCSHFTNLCS